MFYPQISGYDLDFVKAIKDYVDPSPGDVKLSEILVVFTKWLNEEVDCPRIKENTDRLIKVIKEHLKIDVKEKDFDNICGMTPCICRGTSKVPRWILYIKPKEVEK